MKKILSKYYKTLLIIGIALLLIYFIFTIININHYLNKYGYSTKELPKTVATYFHLNKGFTVE